MPVQKYEQARETLARVADRLSGSLEDVDRGFVWVSQSDVKLLTTAFGAFLSGKAKSLDAAFGVRRGPGAPKRGPTRDAIMEIVEKAMWRGMREKSWSDIASETGLSVRYLQRLVERHGEEAIDKLAKEVSERMSAKEGQEAPSRAKEE